jgi:hypothetical protein
MTRLTLRLTIWLVCLLVGVGLLLLTPLILGYAVIHGFRTYNGRRRL